LLPVPGPYTEEVSVNSIKRSDDVFGTLAPGVSVNVPVGERLSQLGSPCPAAKDQPRVEELPPRRSAAFKSNNFGEDWPGTTLKLKDPIRETGEILTCPGIERPNASVAQTATFLTLLMPMFWAVNRPFSARLTPEVSVFGNCNSVQVSGASRPLPSGSLVFRSTTEGPESPIPYGEAV
jgi:hypothetical protein